VVQGFGTPGPHEGGGGTPGTTGRIEDSGTLENETEPLYGGSEFSRELSESMSE
jgi:hypothetical protein